MKYEKQMDYLKVDELALPIHHRSNSVDLNHQKIFEKSLDEPPYLCRSIKRKGFRQRSDTDPGKYKHPRPSALNTLVKHTLSITSGPFGFPVGSPPTFLAPVRPLSSDNEDASSDIIGSYSLMEKKTNQKQEDVLDDNRTKKLANLESAMLHNDKPEISHNDVKIEGLSSQPDGTVENQETEEAAGPDLRRPTSLPPLIKRGETFLRQSLNNILRRGFSKDSSKSYSSSSSSTSDKSLPGKFLFEKASDSEKDESKTAFYEDDQEFKDFINSKETEFTVLHFVRMNSNCSTVSSIGSTNSVNSGIRSAPSTPMAPLQGQSEVHGQSVISLNTIARSPSHHSTNKLESSKSLRQLSPAIPVAASTARSISPHPKSSSSSSTSKNEIPEKEKKRKELSSSRQKKFHRHFQQVSKDERVLNYFSCALVSDILLQGHLYITDNYFAFYSNVFGFVTKLLIPTASVIKISKEKTAKIIPNAVGVATTDERHVFGSFMSREAAFRLMCSVCPPLEPIESIPKVPDVEVSEEYSVEDDSSCSISGNESPPQLAESTTSDASQSVRQRALPTVTPVADVVDGGTSTLDIPDATKLVSAPCSSSTPLKQQSKSPPPRIISSSRTIKFKFPTDFHVVYLGVVLSIVLALFSGFLLYRILDIEAKTRYKSSLEFNWGSGNDVDVYAEALKWQKEMQTKSSEEAQIILNTNLEQIAKVRKSLETLSLLIHDKNTLSSQFESTGEDNNGYVDDETSAIGRGETT